MKNLISTIAITFFYCYFLNAQATQLLEGVQWKSNQISINVLNQAIQKEIATIPGNSTHLTSFVPGANFKVHFYNAIIDNLKKSTPTIKDAILYSYSSVLKLMAIQDDINSDFAYAELGYVVELLKQ